MSDDEERANIERRLGDRYQIIRTLGSGAFGAVYLGRERELHRLVAIKVLRADRAWSPEERERLVREARTVANLSHPAVVPLLTFGESQGTVYMVMPYVSGETLADRLQRNEPFDADEVRRILIEIADALAYVHGEGVLHRDLKPENVLLERAGAVDDHVPPRVRLIDFGVAAFPMRDLGVNARYETWGTPHFMAPEQMFGEPERDARSEIYSLGVLGFLLLGGRLPFEGTSPTERLTQQRKGPVVPLAVCAPSAPKDLVVAIERCLAYEPEQRWRRARDLRDVLVGGAQATGSLAPLSLMRQRLRPKRAAVERFAARRRRADQGAVPLVARITNAFSGLDADVRFAVRTLRKAPGFSAAIILILAIGFGATTVVLSAVEALVLRPLPVADPASLVVLQEKREGPNQTSNFGASAFRYDRFLAFRDATTGIFSGVAAQNLESFSVRIGQQARAINGLTTSGSYFEVLGVRPALGKFYTSSMDRPGGAEAVAVIGYDFWRGALNGDSAIIGRTLFVDSRPMTIVAVAPPGFKGAIGGVFTFDAWIPVPAYAARPPLRGGTGSRTDAAAESQGTHWMNIFGRLRPGVTVRGATEAVRVIAPRVATENPHTKIVDAWAEPVKALPAMFQKTLEQFVGMLFAVACLVLVIAAANAAGMLLARATVRQREVATRLALGGSRARLMRQVVVESALLCTLGGIAGLLLALWLSRFFNVYQPFPLRTDVTFGVNGTVLAIVAAVVLGTGLLAGLAPAFQTTAADLATALKAGGLQAGPRRSRLRSTFVVAQIALSVVLLAVAGLFVRSLQRSLNIDPGFRAAGVVNGGVSVGAHGYDEEGARVFFATLLERLRARPEIAGAALANSAPLSGQSNNGDAKRAEHPDDQFPAQWGVADAGFVELVETRLLAGRLFTHADGQSAPKVTVINATLSQELWPGETPNNVVGRELESLGRRMTVVGVMANGKYGSLLEHDRGFGYVPFAQQFSASSRVYVRARTTTSAALRATGEELAKLDPNVAFERPVLLADDVDKFLVQQRIGAKLIAMFGLVGVALAMTGLYGVLAFSVAQRMREFGVRIAIGAQTTDIFRLVLRHGLVLVAVGIGLGLVSAFAAGRVVSRFLFGLSAADPVTFMVVPVLLVIVALCATLVPARRGAAADPMTSLRAE
ncbi:MAG: ADOP family duplicated permease [bacterium]